MHVVGIDVAGDLLRFQESDKIKRSAIRERFGVAGVPPRIPRESFVWDRPDAARSSRPREVVPLASAWAALADSAPADFKWKYDGGVEGSRFLTDFVGEALLQNVPLMRQMKAVVAVDNRLAEEQQDLLLQSLGAAGASDVELLWRPIALALAFMDSASRSKLKDGDKLLVIDAESTHPEVTCIEVREHNGRLLPLRNVPDQQADNPFEWGGRAIRRKIAEATADGIKDVADQLLAGPFTEQFVAFTEVRLCSDVWCRDGAQHHAVLLSAPEAREKCRQVMCTVSMADIRKAISTQHPVDSMAAVLWHGWPFRVSENQTMLPRDVLMPSDAVAQGAVSYGIRLLDGEPAYLDTLPGLYILSEVRELGTFAYFPLVVPGIWEGGRTWTLQCPLSRFSVKRGVAEFPAVLRRSDEQRCRKVITSIPAPAQDTRVVIRAEMRPAHGRAKVTIEGAEGHEFVFGEKRTVTLDWKSMKEIDDPLTSAPSVYPVRGRLFDDDEYRQIVKTWLANEAATPYSKVTYRGRELAFWKLMEPWGLISPWGYTPNWKSEPTRGMFGAEYVPGYEDISEQIAQRINMSIKGLDRVKFLNYMFVYAPVSFKEELRRKYSEERPVFSNGVGLPSWNWAYAPGRVFSTRADIQLFADFIIRIGKNEYPIYPNGAFTAIYWWSFFRCFCYHSDAVNIPEDRVCRVLQMIDAHVNMEDIEGQTAKNILYAILFSTRIRSRAPGFLQPGDDLCARLVQDVRDRIPNTKWPRGMGSQVDDPHGEGLNGFVLRFLLQTATTQDFKLLEGLTTSMA